MWAFFAALQVIIVVTIHSQFVPPASVQVSMDAIL